MDEIMHQLHWWWASVGLPWFSIWPFHGPILSVNILNLHWKNMRMANIFCRNLAPIKNYNFIFIVTTTSTPLKTTIPSKRAKIKILFSRYRVSNLLAKWWQQHFFFSFFFFKDLIIILHCVILITIKTKPDHTRNEPKFQKETTWIIMADGVWWSQSTAIYIYIFFSWG